MKILQFICEQDPPSSQLKKLLVDQFNTWSRLNWLTTDVDYVTKKYDPSIWQKHTKIPGLWWLNYDDIYIGLGDDGRAIADQLLGDSQFQGALKSAPLVNGMPDTQLKIINVIDLVESGYMTAPEITIY